MSRQNAPPRRVPPYVLITLAVMAAAQILAYFGPKQLSPYLTPRLLTGPLDDLIPFSPPWITVYCLSFPYWAVSGFLILREGKAPAYRIAAAYVLSLAVAAAAFLLWPGTLVRPEVAGDGFFERWVRMIYDADTPTNLCPSMHVIVTYYCFRGALECKKLPRRYTVFAFVFLLLVCCSVLLVKQHALIDVPCGILVGELGMQLSRLLRLERIPRGIEKLFTKKEKE